MSTRPAFDVPEQFVDQLVATLTRQWIDEIDREPWRHLSESERIDHLPILIRQLFRTVISDVAERASRAEMVRTAATHGEQRRAQGFDEDALLEEFYLLRRLLWDYLRDTFGSVGAEGVIAQIDSALSLATAASIRGFHRDGLEARGRWPTALEELTQPDGVAE